MNSPSFLDNYEHQTLLNIAKEQLDALDRARLPDGRLVGQDNFDRLRIATVFSAIAVEAALNDYLVVHYLFLDPRYLQSFFAETKQCLLRLPVREKLKVLKKHWPEELPDSLLADVRLIFEIRNRIVHQSPGLKTFRDTEDGRAKITNSRLTQEDMDHMLRHHEIASDLLGRFWTPGSRELEQWATETE